MRGFCGGRRGPCHFTAALVEPTGVLSLRRARWRSRNTSLGLVPISAPLTVLTHQPMLGYNVALLLPSRSAGSAAHYLAFTLTRRHDAAFIAGVAFAFAPYRLAQVSHIQVLASFSSPICLAALHRYGRTAKSPWADSRCRRLAAPGTRVWLLPVLSLGAACAVAALVRGGPLVASPGGNRLCLLSRCGSAADSCSHGYQTILRDTYGLKRSIGEIRLFSADVAGLLFAADELLVWGWVHVIRAAGVHALSRADDRAPGSAGGVQVRPFARRTRTNRPDCACSAGAPSCSRRRS